MRTMKSPSEIDVLFKAGRRGSTDLVLVLSVKTPDRRGPAGRVVFVAGKKLGNAVPRNRCTEGHGHGFPGPPRRRAHCGAA